MDNNEEKIKELKEELKSLKAESHKKLILEPTEKPSLKVGIMRNGLKYSVRDNRQRFFYPDEWFKFFDKLKLSQKMTFDFLINTGARINEAINVRVGDVDLTRGNIILRVTKVKARKGEKNPNPRTISISSQFAKRLKAHIISANLKNDDLIGLLSKPATHIALKKTLKEVGIKDYYMFSTHNIRKTLGNWLKALGIDGAEICTRLGHDYNTFLKSYGSPDIFSFKDKNDMRLILGDLYQK